MRQQLKTACWIVVHVNIGFRSLKRQSNRVEAFEFLAVLFFCHFNESIIFVRFSICIFISVRLWWSFKVTHIIIWYIYGGEQEDWKGQYQSIIYGWNKEVSGLCRSFLLFEVAFFTGMRAGEMSALKWKNVDFKRRIIRIV